MFIIIDLFDNDPRVTVIEDGTAMWFDNEDEAVEYAGSEMQDGYWQVVEIQKH